MDNPRLDTTALKRFIASLSDSLHSLCNGCMVFDSGIEIVGYINVNIDKGSKLNYVLDEKVERSIDDSITYESNSFLAEKNQSDNVNVPVPDIPISKTPGLFSNKRIAPKRKAFQIMKKQSKRKIHVPKIPKIHVLPKTASSTGPQVVVTRGKSSLYAVVKTEDNEMQMVEPGEELNNEEDDPTFDIEVELRNAGDHDYVEHFDVKTDESGVHFEQLEGDAGAGTSTEQRSTTMAPHRWIEQILEHENILDESNPYAAPPPMRLPPPPSLPPIRIPRLSKEQIALKRANRLEKMARAMQEVRKGMSIGKAAMMFGLPKSTVHDYADAMKAGKVAPDTVYSRTTFSREQENILLTECNQMARLGYWYTASQVIEIAQNMAMLANSRIPTREWFHRGFRKRHPEFNKVRPQTRDKALPDVDDETIKTYFIELDKVMDEAGVKDQPLHIWNLDETGVSLDPISSKVVSYKHDKVKMITAGKSPETTLISAVSAVGEIVPPYFIFKGQRASETMRANTPEGTVFKGSESGWSNSLISKDFLTNHFCRHVTRRPILLLYDGHNTHYPSSLIEEAKQQDIHLFVLPPHSRHCVYERLKQQVNANIYNWSSEHPMQVLQKEDLPELICTSLNMSMTVDAIVYGFRKTGIFDSREVPLMHALREAAAAAETTNTDGVTKVSKKTKKAPAKTRRNAASLLF